MPSGKENQSSSSQSFTSKVLKVFKRMLPRRTSIFTRYDSGVYIREPPDESEYVTSHFEMPSGRENQFSSCRSIISNEPEAELTRGLRGPRSISMSNDGRAPSIECGTLMPEEKSIRNFNSMVKDYKLSTERRDDCPNPENQSSSSPNIISNKPEAELTRELQGPRSTSMVKDDKVSIKYQDESGDVCPDPEMPNGTENQSIISRIRYVSPKLIVTRIYEMFQEKKNNVRVSNNQAQLLIFIVKAIVIMLPMASFIIVNYTNIVELQQPKPVMLYRPTETYISNDKRPETVEWRLVEEHSQNPFTQFNTTHLRVKEDGVYAISCTMLIVIDIKIKCPLSFTLLIYVNGEKPIYIMKQLCNICSIQQSIVLKLHEGDTIFLEIHPSKFLSKASDASHLSIVQQ